MLTYLIKQITQKSVKYSEIIYSPSFNFKSVRTKVVKLFEISTF